VTPHPRALLFASLASLSLEACAYEFGPGTCEHVTVTRECDAKGYCRIPAGCFYMGSPPDEPCREGKHGGRETLHRVLLTHSFRMAQHEVRQEELEPPAPFAHNNTKPEGELCKNGGCVCDGGEENAEPSKRCLDAPAEMVGWDDAARYCNRLSDAATPQLPRCYEPIDPVGDPTRMRTAPTLPSIYHCKGYRLPSEAEWEYAYRAGTRTAYYSGANDPGACTTSDPALDAVAWYRGNLSLPESVHVVGGREANGWGIHDLAGNVFEWTHDGFVDDLGAAPAVDPVGVGEDYKVARGGAIEVVNLPNVLRAAFRSRRAREKAYHLLGFRCVRTAE